MEELVDAAVDRLLAEDHEATHYLLVESLNFFIAYRTQPPRPIVVTDSEYESDDDFKDDSNDDSEDDPQDDPKEDSKEDPKDDSKDDSKKDPKEDPTDHSEENSEDDMSGAVGMFGTLVPNPPGDGSAQKATRACTSCKGQKRKCDKNLPACGLCERMKRVCDYSPLVGTNAIPHQIDALRQDVSTLQDQVAYRFRDIAPPNAFPTSFSLDNQRFQDERTQVPKLGIQLPEDIYRILGSGTTMQAIVAEFNANAYQYFPIVNKTKLEGLGPNELWNGGPEMFCLCLAMMVLAAKSPSDLSPAHHELYLSFKRLLSLMEASGTVSLMVLQANILVNLYEFGHDIYPAALMTVAWSVQYGSLLGINGGNSSQMLGPAISPYDEEERCRTFWGVMIMDRIVGAACNRDMLTYSQFPQGYPTLPSADDDWVNSELQQASPATDINIQTATPFQRLCLSVTILGNVVNSLQQQASASDVAQVQQVNELYLKMNEMSSKWTEGDISSDTFLLAASATAVTLSALFKFFNIHLRAPSSPVADAVRVLTNEGVLSIVATRVVNFAKIVSAAIAHSRGDHISPFLMEPLYQTAIYHLAVYDRHRPDRSIETDFDFLQSLLARIGGRWRSGVEYDRILLAKKLI